jgi:hypothetical protein
VIKEGLERYNGQVYHYACNEGVASTKVVARVLQVCSEGVTRVQGCNKGFTTVRVSISSNGLSTSYK